jgi:subtilase family serine protease
MLMTAGGRAFYITEQTRNIGNAASPPTVTRYFISGDRNIDPKTARVLGERSVPALHPGELSFVRQQAFTIPSDLPEGTYFLVACADANNAVAELDESNNCSSSKQ